MDFSLSFDFKEDLKAYVLGRMLAEDSIGCPLDDIVSNNTSEIG